MLETCNLAQVCRARAIAYDRLAAAVAKHAYSVHGARVRMTMLEVAFQDWLESSNVMHLDGCQSCKEERERQSRRAGFEEDLPL